MSESCSCGENADIGSTVKFECKNCSTLIEEFKIRKPLKAAGIVAILAYGGSQFIDYAITDNRYPLAVEYSVLEACSGSYSRSMSSLTLASSKRRCLCALEDTMNEISYIRFKVNETAFISSFKENIKSCK